MTVYVGDLLTATAASVTGKPTPSRTWQWLRNGTAISGATSSTYTTVEADLAANISVRQTETNIAGSASATSLTVGPINAFSPAALFNGGEEGAWYEPSTTTCFTDTGGTTPATYGDGVAYLQDLSGNGNHATQVTAGARPILARVPEGGRRNLVSPSENFQDAAWSIPLEGEIVSASGVTPPSGVSAAYKFQTSSTANDQYYIRWDYQALSDTFTISMFVKDAGDGYFIQIRPIGIGTGVAYATFDPTDGSLTESGGTALVGTPTSTSVGDGWYRIELTTSADLIDTGDGVGFFLCNSGTAGEIPTFTPASSGLGVYVAGFQFETGSTATAYQKVVDEYDITEAGVTSLDYLAFDGSDDGMNVGTTSTFNFVHDGTGMEILAAVTPSDVANPDALYTFLSTNSATTVNIGFSIGFDDRVSTGRNEALYFQTTRGVTGNPTFAEATTNTITNFTSPTVLRLGYKEAESPEYFAKENQISVYSGDSVNAPSTSDATDVLSIGRLPNATAPWDGKLFGLLILDRLLTTGEASNTEAYLANRSGVTL